MNAATDRQWAVRDAVLRWLLAKATEGYRSPILDADAIGETVGWVPSPLTRDEVADASNYLYREGYVTGVPVMGRNPAPDVDGGRAARRQDGKASAPGGAQSRRRELAAARSVRRRTSGCPTCAVERGSVPVHETAVARPFPTRARMAHGAVMPSMTAAVVSAIAWLFPCAPS